MKKIFKHLLVLMVMFILPMFVLAEETTTFNHIDIDPTVSLKYTVLGEVRSYTATLDSSLAGFNIYRLAQNGTKTKIDITSDNLSLVDGKYRLSGEFDKYYSDETDYKYLVEYEFEVNVQGTTKTITYSREYSYGSENDGILVSLTSEDSIKTFAPSIVINKKVKLNTPDGTFNFKITKGNGTVQNVSVTTKGATDKNEGTGSEIIYLDLNTTYTIEEIEDTTKVYELESISSNRDTDSADKTVTVTTGSSVDDVIEINVVNKSAVDHSKTIQDNGDGTHQLSLDVTGENETAVKKANVIIVMDTSHSMVDNNAPVPRTTYTYDSSTYDNNRYYDNSIGGNRVYYRTRVSSWRTDNRDNAPVYTGTVWAEPRNAVQKTRLAAEQEALYAMIQQLLANNVTSGIPDIIDISVVAYDITSKELQDANGNLLYNTHDYSILQSGISRVGVGHGTNWEDGLMLGLEYADSLKEDYPNEDVYVIFLTDGEPTSRHGLGRYTTEDPRNNYEENAYWKHWSAASDDAKDIATRYNLYTIFTYGVNPTFINYLDNLTHYAYGEGTYSSDTIGVGNDNNRSQYFFNATDTSKLIKALNKIVGDINTSGIGSVTINDGTTQSVTTSAGVSHLLTVDESSYEYWLTFPVTDNNKIKFNDTVVTVTKNSDNTYRLTWTEDGTEKYVDVSSESYFYTSEDTSQTFFVYKWESANTLYNVAPPQAHLEDGSVNWILSKDNVGVLLNGVKYTVTFNVWPSQYTYDLISELDNGIIKYKDLDENIRKYLIYEDGSYTLYTNTTATLKYDDSRDDNGERTTSFANPEPVATGVSNVSIIKDWKNGIDDRYATSIEIFLTRDGVKYGDKNTNGEVLPYTLTKADDWTKLIYIAPGHISINGDTAIVHEIGHDYSFEEKPSDAYYWDLVVNTLHPMKINNKVTMLIKTDESLTEAELNILNSKNYLEKGSDKYYRIYSNVDHDYAIYKEVTGDEANFISATNYRRSNLNITKKVDGICDPDTLFEFSLVVNDSTSTDTNKKDVWFSIWDGTGYVLNTSDATYVVNATIEVIKEGGTITGIVDNGDGTISYYDNGVAKKISFCKVEDGSYYTGFYYAPSGKTITARMKAGWNLRFINLPYNSTYTFNEVLSYVLGNNVRVSDAFDLTKVELNIVQKNDKGSTVTNSTGTISVATATANANSLVNNYKIDEYNTQYTIIYTNSPKTTSREVIKTWEEDTINTRPDSITVHLYGDGKEMYTQTINSADNWRYTWNNLPIYNAQGNPVNYTVTEDSVTGYIPEISGFNITNYYNLRSIKVNKDWSEGAKKASVVVRLTSKKGDNIYKIYNITLSDGNWTHTWNNLDKYYLDENDRIKTITYSVSEISINGEELGNNVIVYDYNEYIHSTIGKWILKSITSNADQSEFTIANDYKSYALANGFNFKKMSFKDYYDDPTKGLNGAVFRLYKYVGDGVSSNTPITNLDNPGDDWIIVDTVTSRTVNGVDGMMIFNRIFDGSEYLDGLYDGEYRLVEIQAPAGYVAVSGQWRLFIDLNKVTDLVSIRNFSDYTEESPVSIGKTTAPTADGNGNIIILNEEVPDIPTTGGIGIPHYNNFGLLMMILSVVIYLVGMINQRKQIENI